MRAGRPNGSIPLMVAGLNWSNWNAQIQAAYSNEIQCYTEDDSPANKNYDVSGGTLKIIARRQAINAPPAREDSPLSVGLEALPGFQAAVGRGRQDTAVLCAARIRRLPEVREA